MSHTPGPWRLDDVSHPFGHSVELRRDTYHFIDAGQGFLPTLGGGLGGFGIAAHMSEADAALITASPELLDLAVDALRTFEEIEATRAPIHPACNAAERAAQEDAMSALRNLIAAHRHVIAKARGGK